MTDYKEMIVDAITGKITYREFEQTEINESIPSMWSSYNGTIFTPPTEECLISIGVITLKPEETPNE